MPLLMELMSGRAGCNEVIPHLAREDDRPLSLGIGTKQWLQNLTGHSAVPVVIDILCSFPCSSPAPGRSSILQYVVRKGTRLIRLFFGEDECLVSQRQSRQNQYS